ncbi:MAG: SufE family protein [Alphaproteobacteria bacterium]|nr:SufE family protein [Alphaproteobacteria bacterium]MCL2889944.1 SufE family protein [Alphaproteobacteria bacterium]
MNYNEIKTILLQIHDPAERLEFVMDLGRQLVPIPENVRSTEIKGCASHVAIYRDENNNYYGESDSVLVRGIVVLLLSMAAGKSPAQLRDENLADEFESLHLHLGTGRMNGVNGVIEFLTKE